MNLDSHLHKHLALTGGIIGGLFAFLAIYKLGAFISNDKPLAYLLALVTSLCVIWSATKLFSKILSETQSR